MDNRGIRIAFALVGIALGAGSPPRPEDDRTFRPTVIVVRGTSQGSGTVIASVPGETLVLTAAHVVDTTGQAFVEVHRYNLGLEGRRDPEGWPKKIPARVIAADRAADLAVLRIEGFVAMPYVARLADDAVEGEVGSLVTSVGVDRGARLTGCTTRLIDFTRVEMHKGGGFRPFVLTEKPPDFGRSGGGLFRADGAVVGVCVGKVEVIRGRRVGLFASNASIRRLLEENDLAPSIARSLARRLPSSGRVEPTRAVAPLPPPPGPAVAVPR